MGGSMSETAAGIMAGIKKNFENKKNKNNNLVKFHKGRKKSRKRKCGTGKVMAGRTLRQLRAVFLAAAVVISVGDTAYAREKVIEPKTESAGESAFAEDTESACTLHHAHTGSGASGGGCYTKALFHVHRGNPGVGGVCYNSPVYHEHTGDEKNGGGCYGEKVYHSHEGDEETGGACYGTPVYHSHEGNDNTGGGCYQLPVYHSHEGGERTGGVCYGTPVYHVHTGNASSGGGCYTVPVCHVHSGKASEKGGCYGTPVYHRHAGSSASGGGCYGMPVYHSHTGNVSDGGGCYGTAVYHVHTGKPSEQGGCYQTPVYHVHQGNGTSGGACYGAVYHEHTDACYETRECEMKCTGGVEVERTESGFCYHCGQAQVAYVKANYMHESCGEGETRASHSLCWGCQYFDRSHEYKALVCGRDEKTIEAYRLICGKTDTTAESWQPACGKTEKTLEGYALNCGKTEKTVDSYRINCGKGEGDIDAYEKNCGKTEKTVESYRIGCGKTGETVESYKLSCPKTEKSIDSYKKNCGKTEETVEHYALSCGMTEETVSSYARNCKKNEKSIDAYALSCKKTEQTIDGYDTECGKTEGELCGGIFLKNKTEGWSGGCVSIQACFTGGAESLCFPADAFCWEGGGIADEQGETLSVKENGVYRLHLSLNNENIAEKDISLAMRIANIDRTAPSVKVTCDKAEAVEKNRISISAEDLQPDGSPGSGLAKEAYSFDGGNTWGNKSELEVTANGTVTAAVRDVCGNTAEQTVEVKNIREEEDNPPGENEDPSQEDEDPSKGDGDPDDNEPPKAEPEKEKQKQPEQTEPEKEPERRKAKLPEKKKESVKDRIKNEIKLPQKKEPDDTDSQEQKEKYQKEEITVPQKKTAAEPAVEQLQTVGKRSVLEPVIKAVTYTAGGVALAAGLFYLIFLMYRSIKVYDYDKKEKTRYAGSCVMRKTKSGFEVRIPDMILEHSDTGEYSLRPGKAFAGKHKGEELVIIAGGRKVSVWIEEEIPLRLSAHA